METVNEKDYEYANHVGYKLINKMDWEGMYQKTNSASTRISLQSLWLSWEVIKKCHSK